MKKKVLVAGGTGDLGGRIVNALLENGAEVRVLVRLATDPAKIKLLEQAGVKVITTDFSSVDQLTEACIGVTCVVSALAGMRDVVVDVQKVLLDAAVKAGVPRFIPSDYSVDFTRFPAGRNRNLDWRREFHTYIDQAPIRATSIYCGGFMDMLTGQMPMIFFKRKLIMFWGKADHPYGMTTVANVATFTAHVALDSSAPRALWIAGDQPSPRYLQEVMGGLTGQKFHLIRAGGQGLLNTMIKIIRKVSPGENELYPAWQGMQYLSFMIDDRSKLERTDNDRYPGIAWTTAKDVLAAHVAKLSL